MKQLLIQFAIGFSIGLFVAVADASVALVI